MHYFKLLNSYFHLKYSILCYFIYYLFKITMNKNFNKLHRVCIGDIINIPKDTLSISDYIFFDDIEQINKYLRLSNYNIEIKGTDSKIYLVDKCNYKDCHLFSFDNYIK